MSREISYFDGTSWTTTKVAPTRNAPFAGVGGTQWTTTRVAPTRNAPFAGLGAVELSPGKTVGVEWSWVLQGNRAPTEAELTALLKAFIESHRLELVGKPVRVADTVPVWVWKSEANEYGGGKTWWAEVATGPFKGLMTAVRSSYAPPTQQDTIALPQALVTWTARLKPVTLEEPESLRAQLVSDARADTRLKAALSSAMGVVPGEGPVPNTNAKLAAVDQKSGGRAAVATAAIIGIALTMISIGSGKHV